jgi:Holliday junction DNA helicase RuvB
MAATLNESQSTLVEVVEPYLLQIGFLARTPGGRKATLAAYQHLHVPATPPGDQRALEM